MIAVKSTPTAFYEHIFSYIENPMITYILVASALATRLVLVGVSRSTFYFINNHVNCDGPGWVVWKVT